MKNFYLILLFLFAITAFANEASNTDASVEKVAVKEEATTTVDPAVEKRRAEIQKRLESNKKLSESFKNKDSENNKRMAAMRVQKQKTDGLRLKISKTEAAIAARKDAVVKTNEDAAALAKEISDLEAKIKEKTSALEKITSKDEETKKLTANLDNLKKQLSDEVKKTSDMIRENMKTRMPASTKKEVEEKKAE
jgi:predicted  nucleic acid-binding Zn-ribbon protein